MQLLEFAADGGDGADLGADGATNAEFRVDIGFFTHSSQEILDSFGGAYCGAEAAIDASVVIDAGKVVLYCNGLNWAFAGADAATDAGTGGAADSFGIRTFFLGGTFDIYVAIDGNQHDELAGAGFYTRTATGTFVEVDHPHAILVDGDGIKYTGFLAIV